MTPINALKERKLQALLVFATELFILEIGGWFSLLVNNHRWLQKFWLCLLLGWYCNCSVGFDHLVTFS